MAVGDGAMKIGRACDARENIIEKKSPKTSVLSVGLIGDQLSYWYETYGACFRFEGYYLLYTITNGIKEYARICLCKGTFCEMTF